MQKMKMPIITSVIVIALVATGLGMGTMAWFSDSENVAITITAGNVDLRIALAGGTYGDGFAVDFPEGFAPGDSFEIHVYLKNVGNAGSKTLWVYGDNLVGPNKGLADHIYISNVTFTDDTGISGSGWTTPPMLNYESRFGDKVNELTITDFTTVDLENEGYMRFYWGTWFDKDYLEANGDSVQQVKLTFTFDEDADNEWQGRACGFDIVFLATDDQGYGLIWPVT